MPPAGSTPLPPGYPEKRHDFLAALLSYLLPGLGQVMQGRIGKGVLFFVCLNALFFYGMMMGQWKNVWLPDPAGLPRVTLFGRELDGVPKAVWHRPQFLGQMWIGVAAWPSLFQYASHDPNKDTGPLFGAYQREPKESELNDLQRNGNKRWDLGWVFTVIAGVLNMLVIYDAFAGPVVLAEDEEKKSGGQPPAPGGPPK
jgi:hypothetical protein